MISNADCLKQLNGTRHTAGCDENHVLLSERKLPLHFILIRSFHSIMNPVNERIIKFIEKNQVMTLATCDGAAPYCCSIFYVFHAEKCCFYLMSSADTKHIQHAMKHPLVAGTIVSGDTSIAKIQGIQFTGKIYQPNGDELSEAKKFYLKKFPMAHLFDSDLWAVEMDFIKMTDNTLGFGKKILWNRISENVEV